MLWPTGSEATRVLLFAQHHGRVALVSAHLTGPRVRHFSRDTVQRGCRLVWAEFDFAEITRTDVVPLNEATFSAHDLTCLGRVLTAAEILGAMQWALDASVRRARERKQFDQPIGGFQAVAHRCADMLCAVELCRSIVYAAAASQDGRGTPDTDLSSFARLLLWQESLPVLTTALQLFGADGLRWSSDLHLQLRRGQVLRQLWETPCGVADEMTGYLAASVQASGRQQRRA
jgi:alkylation response protein AidB-like acyl-CoA dehydrogenase